MAGVATSIVSVAPKVLSRQTQDWCDKQVFGATKHFFCREKNMLVATKLCLPRPTRVSRDKTCFATNICRNKHNFVATKVLSQQAYFCRDKHMSFVATKVCLSRQNFCRDKIMFVATKLCLSVSKKYLPRLRFCRNKHTFVAKNICRATSIRLLRQAYFLTKMGHFNKHIFVATSIGLSGQKTCLSRQKGYLRQLPPMIEKEKCQDGWHLAAPCRLC